MKHFDFRMFFWIAYLSFFKSHHRGVQLTPRRLIFLLGFFTIFPLIQLFNGLFFLLDVVFYPQHKHFILRKPLFIIGVPRSGTTYIHRLIAQDTSQFFYTKAWELIFPSIIQEKFWTLVGTADQFLGGHGGKMIAAIEARWFKQFNRIHKISLFSAEEDDKFLAHIFSFHGLVWFFPFPDELQWLTYFDQEAKPEAKKRIMEFYTDCLKRQAYLKGKGRHFISKNPFSSFKIDTLYNFFPDGKFLYLIRNPLETIPSMLSMATEILRKTNPMAIDSEVQEQAYMIAKSFYEYPLQRLRQADPDSYIIVKYDDLMENPSATVTAVYNKFGYMLSSEFRHILDQETARANSYKSHHDYSLDQFSISSERILCDLDYVFKEFGFARFGADLPEKCYNQS